MYTNDIMAVSAFSVKV